MNDTTRVVQEVLPKLSVACVFHGHAAALQHGAYHDLASLFGLDTQADDWRHANPLNGPHFHANAQELLSGRLLRLCDREHPTRIMPSGIKPSNDGMGYPSAGVGCLTIVMARGGPSEAGRSGAG